MLAGCTPRAPFGDDRAALSGAGGAAGVTDAGPGQGPLSDLGPNEAKDLGAYECTDLEGSAYPCQSIYDYSRFVYDHGRHQLLWFGGGDHATPRTDVTALDLDSPTWQSAYAPTPCSEMTPANADMTLGAWKSTGHPMSRQTYDMLVMAENTGELVMLTYNTPGADCSNWPESAPNLYGVPGRVAHYDPDARTWRFSSAPANLWAPDAAAEFDPVSGLVVVLSEKGLWTYDPRSERIEQRLTIDDNSRLGYSAELVYFPPTDRFYHFTRPGLLFEITPDRGDWAKTEIAEVTDAAGSRAAETKGWAYDSVRHTLGGGVRDGTFYEFDPASRRWTERSIPGDPGNLAFFTLVFDQTDGVYVFFTDYPSGYKTWAYRP